MQIIHPDIIGGGIGGLTTAIALSKKGINSTVYEQAKSLKPVGAGIILGNNAMQVYQRLGIEEELKSVGNHIKAMNVTDHRLNLISGVKLQFFEQKYHSQNIAIHRGKLQEVLSQHLSPDQIHTGHALQNVESGPDHSYTLSFKNGKTLTSSFLIGADGIHSQVRNSLFSDQNHQIRDAHQVCWRGILDFDLPKQYQHELNECWGKGSRFGFVQIAPGKVYWYALTNFVLTSETKEAASVSNISKYFTAYHSLVRELIQSTDVSTIHTAHIADLKPTHTWVGKNVCLVGDAAHATTPNLGQGACQSIEDAYILAECLSTHDPNVALKEYQKLRLPKAHLVVNNSWRLGKMAHWSNPIAVGLRNTLMKWAPDSVGKNQSDKIFQLEIA